MGAPFGVGRQTLRKRQLARFAADTPSSISAWERTRPVPEVGESFKQGSRFDGLTKATLRVVQLDGDLGVVRCVGIRKAQACAANCMSPA